LIYQKSKDCNAPLIYTDNENNNFIIEQLGNGKYKTKFGDISMSLCGDYQYYNLNLALNVIQELKIKGYHIENEHIISGINSIYENTGFCGRWQILNETPLVILDAGHTYEAWKTVIPQLLKLNYNKLYIVSTIYTNRDANKITEMYPDDENIEYLFPMSYTNILRTPQELLNATMWMKKSKRHETKHITKILKPLLKNSKQDDVIFIMGSTVHIGTINDLFKNIK
jgi:dihydrofolate synthase/folylpolyglutamate synthase